MTLTPGKTNIYDIHKCIADIVRFHLAGSNKKTERDIWRDMPTQVANDVINDLRLYFIEVDLFYRSRSKYSHETR